MKLEEILGQWDKLASIELREYAAELYQSTVRPDVDGFEIQPVTHNDEFLGVTIRNTKAVTERWHWVFPTNIKAISFGEPADLISETHAKPVKVEQKVVNDEEVLRKKRPAPKPKPQAKPAVEKEPEPDVDAAMEMAALEEELAAIKAQEERAMSQLDGSEDEEYLTADE
jgi:hypothetical protein